LTGDVPSRALRAQAGEIASVHPDVESAVNDLQVRPGDEAVPDEEQQTQGTLADREHPQV
jgi:osmotically-inducible protein OsmY